MNEAINPVAPEVPVTTEPTAAAPAEPVENADKSTDPAPVKNDADTAEDAKQRAIQKRIDRLTRDKYEAKAEAEYLKGVLARGQTQSQASPQDGRPQQSQYASAEDFVEALTDWKLAQRDRQLQAHHAQKAHETATEKREKLFAAAEELGNFDREDFASNVRVTTVMADAILDSDVGAKLVLHLNANPEEATRIANLPPARQAAEIGKLEIKVSTAPTKQVSNAPAPISPIAGKAGGSKDPSEMTDAEFAKWRRSYKK